MLALVIVTLAFRRRRRRRAPLVVRLTRASRAGCAYAGRSGGWTIAKAENVGSDISNFFRREDQVRHLRVRRCEEHPQSRRGHAACIGDIPESRSDDDASWFLLLGLHDMAGVTRFASESMPSGDVAALRMRIRGGHG